MKNLSIFYSHNYCAELNICICVVNIFKKKGHENE